MQHSSREILTPYKKATGDGRDEGPVQTIPPTVVGTPKINITYPAQVEVAQQDSILFAINVENNGDVDLNNLRMFISTSSFLEVDINPLQIGVLRESEKT